MESLIKKFTNQCVCFKNYLLSRSLEKKDNYLRGAWAVHCTQMYLFLVIRYVQYIRFW